MNDFLTSLTDFLGQIGSGALGQALIGLLFLVVGLMAVLQHFGFTDVLAPLQDMMAKFTSAVPNIIGAGVIGYAGWIIAKIVSEIFARVLQFGGGLLVGGLILVIGNFLSPVAFTKLSADGTTGLANIARIAILGLVLAMGLKSMGLADHIVNMAFGFTIGSVAVAAAVAFGLGARDAAKR